MVLSCKASYSNVFLYAYQLEGKGCTYFGQASLTGVSEFQSDDERAGMTPKPVRGVSQCPSIMVTIRTGIIRELLRDYQEDRM